MAEQTTCHTCIYACWDKGLWLRTLGSGFPARPTCANQPDSFGRLKECPSGRVCRNYQPKPLVPKGDAVKLIPLGDGVYAYVDAADYEWLNQWAWHAYPDGYAARYENGKKIYMHRQIMQPPEGMVVDHIDGNRANNCRGNLRVCTRQENMHNKRKQNGSSSLYKGVGYLPRRGKWYARIWFMCERVCAGNFADEVEAGRAYDWWAVGLFGESARLNFPEEWPPERRAQAYGEAREKREALIAKAQAKRRKDKGRKKNGKETRAAQRQKPPKARRRKRATRTRSRKTASG
jgi:hypothetical protein